MEHNEMHNNVILVDMDGVLADFDRAVIERLPGELVLAPRVNFYIDEDYPDHRQAIHEITSHPDFFHDLEPVDSALDGWQRLVDLGYDPRICSAPLTRNPKSIEGKRAWLRKHFVPVFGQQVLSRAIIDKQKYKYDGLVLIDDRPNMNTNHGQASWKHIVFDREYNQDSSADHRMFGWNDPNIASILEQARNS